MTTFTADDGKKYELVSLQDVLRGTTHSEVAFGVRPIPTPKEEKQRVYLDYHHVGNELETIFEKELTTAQAEALKAFLEAGIGYIQAAHVGHPEAAELIAAADKARELYGGGDE